MSVDDYVVGNPTTIELPLRRSIQVPLRYSTIASQFTQSEAKGRTLVLQQFYCT